MYVEHGGYFHARSLSWYSSGDTNRISLIPDPSNGFPAAGKIIGWKYQVSSRATGLSLRLVLWRPLNPYAAIATSNTYELVAFEEVLPVGEGSKADFYEKVHSYFY